MLTELARKMVELADKDGLPEGHELRTHAEMFDIAAQDYFDNKNTARKYLGCWARARRVWCIYTGEPLI